jgi:L-threonylcarbamoyladenylate synthase
MTDFEEDIKKCVEVLQQGGTILYPTDTIWGIGCNALNEAAVELVFKIKNRPKQKSMIVLLPEEKDILQYVAAPHPDIIEILQSFKTPTTVIYNDALGFPYQVTDEDGSLGIRITNDAFCKGLLKRFRKPIISTSANLSGWPAPTCFQDIHPSILQQVDYVVKHRQNDGNMLQASRILRILADGSFQIIRN